MEFEIHSVNSIIRRAKYEFPMKTMLISIGDPDAPSPKLLHKPDFVLRLLFDDITPEDAVDRLELSEELLNEPEKLNEILKDFNTFLFTDDMANDIVKFVKQHIEEASLLICQCEYGRSRSAAVGAAIMECFNGTGSTVFSDAKYSPNLFVYKKLLKKLRQ